MSSFWPLSRATRLPSLPPPSAFLSAIDQGRDPSPISFPSSLSSFPRPRRQRTAFALAGSTAPGVPHATGTAAPLVPASSRRRIVRRPPAGSITSTSSSPAPPVSTFLSPAMSTSPQCKGSAAGSRACHANEPAGRVTAPAGDPLRDGARSRRSPASAAAAAGCWSCAAAATRGVAASSTGSGEPARNTVESNYFWPITLHTHAHAHNGGSLMDSLQVCRSEAARPKMTPLSDVAMGALKPLLPS